MPANPQALSALRRLAQSSYRPDADSSLQDPNVQRYHLAGQMADETKDRIIANERAAAASAGMASPADAGQNAHMYGGEADALRKLLDTQEETIQETGIPASIDEANQYRQQERQAILSGFSGGRQGGPYLNPLQQAAQYGREAETAKINAPVEAARLGAEGNIEAQRLQSQGQRDVAKIQADSLASQYAALQAALSGGNPDAIRGVTLPKGGGSISYTPEKPPNPTLLRDITTLRGKMQQSGKTDWLGRPTPEKTAYDSAVAAAIASQGADESLNDLAYFAADNEDLQNLPVEQFLQHPKVQAQYDTSQMTPEEINQLGRLLLILRGMPTQSRAPAVNPFFAIQ